MHNTGLYLPCLYPSVYGNSLGTATDSENAYWATGGAAGWATVFTGDVGEVTGGASMTGAGTLLRVGVADPAVDGPGTRSWKMNMRTAASSSSTFCGSLNVSFALE